MKKRVFAGIMIMVLMFASVMGVSAAPSRTDEIYVSGTPSDYFETTDSAKTESDLKSEASTEVKEEIKDKTLIWKVFDLTETGTNTPVKNSNGKYDVQLTVTTMTNNQKDFVIVYFDDATGEWKTLKPEVDYKNKTLVFELESIANVSAMGVYATKLSGGAAGTSPSTEGTSSAWMLWMAVAIVALGAGVVVAQKKSR